MAEASSGRKVGTVSSNQDLRTWLHQVEALGELKVISGAHWDLEIGVLSEVVERSRRGPAVLFDSVPGYPKGYRILVNSLGSIRRIALSLGLPLEIPLVELMVRWREKLKSLKPVPVRTVTDGPVMKNALTGQAVDLYKLPTPKWHEHDGGRYLGTACAVATMDPEEGWVNVGTYRMMILDEKRAGLYISPGKHGRLHREKWFASKRPMPVAVSLGHDPLMFLVSSIDVPYGTCEYDYAGGIKGTPVEVLKGPITGLPIPAQAEIVLEGFVHPDKALPEGPFGEWTGYYASAVRDEPFMEVAGLYCRNDPIILGAPPLRPPTAENLWRAFLSSAQIWEFLERSGVPDVTGVWCHEAGAAKLFIVVAIKQRYAGHAKQAAIAASQGSQAGAYLGRYVVVVDEDIDAMNLEEVIWAMCTRAEPARDIDVVRQCWSGPLDPLLSPQQREAREYFNSRAIIDATRPFHWKEHFPRVSQSSPETRNSVLTKWRQLVDELTL